MATDTLAEIQAHRRRAREFLAKRKQAYSTSFTAEGGKQVLEDLEKFCRANISTFDPDPRVHALMEGRREVWLRIKDHLDLSTDELFSKYGERK